MHEGVRAVATGVTQLGIEGSAATLSVTETAKGYVATFRGSAI
jgi:hypothetical protein